MNIHPFEKAWIALSMVLIVGFVATVAYGAVGVGVQMVDDSGGQIDPAEVRETAPFDDPGVEHVGGDRYEVAVVAEQFRFDPGTAEPIRLPAGANVTFHVTSADVIHGFMLAGTNVNVMAVPGQISEITVEFDETGTYGIVCHEYCGAAHHQMAGTLEVVPESEYDGPGGDAA